MEISRPRPRPKVRTLETETAHERHQRIYSLKTAYSRGRTPTRPKSKHELDVLKERHRFIREEESPEDLDWEDQLALKYYNSLFREYCVVNLKKYKTGAIALRWRTESEVLSGIAHLTCASLRCQYHEPPPSSTSTIEDLDPESTEPLVPTRLDEFEVPFTYMEEGERKSVLVKVVLCEECGRKLMYGKRKEKAEKKEREGEIKEKGSKRGREEEEEGDYTPDLPPDLPNRPSSSTSRSMHNRNSSSTRERRRSASPPRRR